MIQKSTLQRASGRKSSWRSPPPFSREKQQLQRQRGQVSELGDATGAPDKVSQPLGQATSPGLLDVEGSGEESVEGAIAHGHHCAGEADDVVGHAEVRRRQAHQQRLCVEPHKVAGTVRHREPGGQEAAVRQDPAPHSWAALGQGSAVRVFKVFLASKPFQQPSLMKAQNTSLTKGQLPCAEGEGRGPAFTWLPLP